MKEREAARVYGSAMRVGVVACGRSPDLLKALHIIVEDGDIRIAADHEHEALLTERVLYRIHKLKHLL